MKPGGHRQCFLELHTPPFIHVRGQTTAEREGDGESCHAETGRDCHWSKVHSYESHQSRGKTYTHEQHKANYKLKLKKKAVLKKTSFPQRYLFMSLELLILDSFTSETDWGL